MGPFASRRRASPRPRPSSTASGGIERISGDASGAPLDPRGAAAAARRCGPNSPSRASRGVGCLSGQERRLAHPTRRSQGEPMLRALRTRRGCRTRTMRPTACRREGGRAGGRRVCRRKGALAGGDARALRRRVTVHRDGGRPHA